MYNIEKGKSFLIPYNKNLILIGDIDTIYHLKGFITKEIKSH
jgi:hypothetical protein